MNKVLYVEDEYHILKRFLSEDGLFGPFLTKREKKDLNDIYKKKELLRNAITDCLTNNRSLMVKFDFLDALQFVQSNEIFDYDYFIIDRNLNIARELDLIDVQEIDKDFSVEDLEYIQNLGNNLTREGDYLLYRLYWTLKKRNMEKKLAHSFFFFSAYEADDVFLISGGHSGQNLTP